MITLERLDELQHGRGEPVSSDELIELVHASRLTHRLRRSLESHVRRIDSIVAELDEIAPREAPEPLPIVDAVIGDEEVESL